MTREWLQGIEYLLRWWSNKNRGIIAIEGGAHHGISSSKWVDMTLFVSFLEDKVDWINF
jgi:hypothetical protein